MIKSLMTAGLAVVSFTPSLAAAQNCQERHDNRVAGTVIGAGVGALLGGAISGGRTGGVIVGGVGGAVAGNAIAGSSTNCGNQYGYYDANGAWVPNTANAQGYYGPDGRWVANAPPPGPSAYAPVPPPYASSGPGYAVDADYADRGRWGDAPPQTRQREDWLEDRVRRAMNDGAIERNQALSLIQDVDTARRMDNNWRRGDGDLDPSQRAEIERRLNDVRFRLRKNINQNVRDNY